MTLIIMWYQRVPYSAKFSRFSRIDLQLQKFKGIGSRYKYISQSTQRPRPKLIESMYTYNDAYVGGPPRKLLLQYYARLSHVGTQTYYSYTRAWKLS